MLLVPAHRRGASPICSDAVFVTVWMENYRAKKTLFDVAQALGYSENHGHVSVSQRANSLRLRGVMLPYFSTKNGSANALNAIVFGS